MKKSFIITLIIFGTFFSTKVFSIINSSDTVIFDLHNAVYAAHYIDVPVLFRSNDIINAVDFAVKFNELNLTYDSIFNITPYLSIFSNFNLLDRTLRFTSSSLQTIQNDTALILVRFTFTAPCGKITIADFNTITVYLNGDPCSYLFTTPDSNNNLATFTNNNACLGQSVMFNGTPAITGVVITNWSWNFGNGDTSNIQNPSVNYITTGSYNTSLIVTSDAGCRDTIIHVINAHYSPVAAFTSIADCSNSSVAFTDNSTIAAGTINSWAWNFGDTATNNIQNPIHIYASGGTYPVGLTVVSDSGCTANISNTVIINSPTANFNQPSGCAGATISFNDSSIANSGAITSWNWYFGDGNSSTQQNTSHVYSSGGNYTVSLKVNTGNGCADSIARVITIQAIPVINFAGDILTGCAPLSVVFSDSSVTSANSTYSWNFGDTTFASTINASHLFATGGTYNITHYVTTTLGCADSLTKPAYVIVNPKPAVNFTSYNSCINSPVTFTDNTTVSTGTITNWNWNFGDGNFSSQQSPANTYTTGGPYTITLSTITSQGCSDSISHTITIVNRPLVNFSGTNLFGCVPLHVNFTDASIATSGSSYSWNFGDNNSSSLQNPIHTYIANGVFDVTHYVTTPEGCIDSLVMPGYVTTGGGPVAQFSVNNPCVGSTSFFNDSSTISSGTISNWSWSFGDGNGSSQQNPAYNYGNPGTYSVQLIVSNSIGCTDSITRTITIEATPVVNFVGDVLIGCTPLTVNFYDSSVTTFGSAFFWRLGDLSTSSSMDAAHIYNNTGLYTITHIVTTPLGCKDSLTKPNYIKVELPPTTLFTISPDVLKLPKAIADFTNLSNGTSSWLWSFGDSLYSTQKSPEHTYAEAGVFTVCLTAKNIIGCASTYCDTLTVLQTNPVAVPAAFTPNGDNINDILFVRGGPIKEMDWRIFNEWGNQIFFSDNQSEGWDGTFKDKPQPQGVYEYTLKGITTDGTVINLYGVVNLVR